MNTHEAHLYLDPGETIDIHRTEDNRAIILTIEADGERAMPVLRKAEVMELARQLTRIALALEDTHPVDYSPPACLICGETDGLLYNICQEGNYHMCSYCEQARFDADANHP